MNNLAIAPASNATLALVPAPAPAPPPTTPTTPVKGRSFMSVFEEVQQRSADMLPDRTVRISDLAMTPAGHLELPGRTEYRLNDWSRKQLASLVGVRWTKWFSTATPEERADEVSRRLARTPGELKVRAWRSHDNEADGTARALLSPGMTPIDDIRIFTSMHTMMRGLVEDEYRFTTVQFTETTSTFAAVRTEALTIDGDVLYPGFNLRSSETGAAAVSLDDYMLRLACLNGLMVRVGGKRSLYRTHRAIEDDALAAALVIAIGRLPERAATVVSWLSASKSIIVPHPDDAVAAILDSAAVPKALLEEAQRVVLRDGDNTRHGVIQAITLVAHSHPSTTPDIRHSMEQLAGLYLAASQAA